VPFPPYPTVPNPSTWASGPILTRSLRRDVTNAVLFLANRPLYAGQISTGNSINSGVEQPLGMNVELVDTWQGHQASVAFGISYYCQAPGWYLAEGTVPWAYSTATQALFYNSFSGLSGGTAFDVRGQLQLVGSGHNPSPQICDLIKQSVTGPIGGGGDLITLNGVQITGSPLSLAATATELPYVTIRWAAATSGTVSLPVPSNPAWPVPPLYVTSAGYLNPAIRDTIRFLTYPPIYRAHYTAGSASLPNQTFPAGTVVPLTTIDVDNYSGGTTGTSASYTAPVAGVYFLHGQVNLAASGNQLNLCAGLQVNGGTIAWGTSAFALSNASGNGAVVTRRLRLSAGDVVQFCASQGSPGAIAYNTTAANQTRFIAVWECS
jgi:hypothetical protein